MPVPPPSKWWTFGGYSNPCFTVVFDSDCCYDVILCSDFLQKSGIDIKYSNGRVEWFGNTIPLREAPRVKTYEEDFKTFIDDYLSQMEDEKFEGYLYDDYSASILDAKYEKVDVDGLAKEQSHLTEIQQEYLYVISKKHEELFSGKLGYYPHRKFHI